LASCQEDTQTAEEYNAEVIAHFAARGQAAPARALKG
jgi:hypothetical protein